jgi:hypothetical protein
MCKTQLNAVLAPGQRNHQCLEHTEFKCIVFVTVSADWGFRDVGLMILDDKVWCSEPYCGVSWRLIIAPSKVREGTGWLRGP